MRQTAAFRDWFAKLRDIRAQAHIVRRIERAQAGNMGDLRALGEGLSEMRIHYGPGYRLYLAQRGERLAICSAAETSPASPPTSAGPGPWRRN